MTRETSEQVHEAITDAIVRLLEQYHSELEQVLSFSIFCENS